VNKIDIELLAKQMRESALLRTANPNLTMQELTGAKLEIEKRNQIERVEKMKKLYFNAGRWAGGARDHNAREAHYKVMGE
jgi:DNA-binding transcriptional regulator WhiA